MNNSHSSDADPAWNDALRLELDVLLNQATDETLTETARLRLQEILRTSPAARVHYVRFRGLEMSLSVHAGEAQVQEEWPKAEPSWWRRSFPKIALGAAAALAVSLMLWQPWSPSTQALVNNVPNEESDQDTAATLLTSENCRWGGDGAFKVGEIFRQGQRLVLESGVAEVSFDCGARLAIQGPSELLLRSPWEAFLVKGLVRANVPPAAIGFRVSSPEVDVVDLGTEFSLASDETSGASDVLVHEGKVQVKPKGAARANGQAKSVGNQKALLKQNEGRRFIKNGGSSVVAASDVKWQALSGRFRPLRGLVKEDAILWTFDSLDTLLPTTQLLAKNAPVFSAPLLLKPGKYGQGLWFTEAAAEVPISLTLTEAQANRESLLTNANPNANANTNVGPSAPVEALTFAAWLKVDDAANLGDAGTWLSYAPQLPLPGEITLGWNGNPTQGVAGAGTLSFGNRTLVGATPLNDGKWHHVAGVFGLHHKPKGSVPGMMMSMRLYVDGKLEVPSAKFRQKSHEPVSMKLQPRELRLGNDGSGDTPFLGQLDEVFFLDRPINANELSFLNAESGRK